MITTVLYSASSGLGHFGPSLWPTGENMGWLKANPRTYFSSNPVAYQPKGDLKMAIGQVTRCEKINNCKLNIFEYKNQELVSIRFSRKCDT